MPYADATETQEEKEMILADKIINERKKLNLSQEELAEKLSVSRQAVSKWESAQSIPDLQRIIAMSELFSVSTDYLLKDEIEAESVLAAECSEDRAVRRVFIEEANEYLAAMKQQSKTVALGVLMCILSPVLMIFLAGLSESGLYGINETLAAAVGLAVLFLLVAAAVYLFIQNGTRTVRFEYLAKEEFETAYGVSGMVKERKSDFEPKYRRYLSIGIVLCIVSPVPLIISALINEADYVVGAAVALLLCIAAVGVYMIVRVGTVMTSYNVLLQEGDYRKEEKKKSKAVDSAAALYWGITTAVYLTWSFISEDWDKTWIVWAIAGVVFAPAMGIVKAVCKKDK